MGAGLRARLGDIDGAIACLRRELDERSLHSGAFSKEAFYWAPLRGDPRFQAILEKMNLAD